MVWQKCPACDGYGTRPSRKTAGKVVTCRGCKGAAVLRASATSVLHSGPFLPKPVDPYWIQPYWDGSCSPVPTTTPGTTIHVQAPPPGCPATTGLLTTS